MPADDETPDTPDPIDVEAAQIDPRGEPEEVEEEIEHLKEDAEALGRDVED
jgi:hypothetical protein